MSKPRFVFLMALIMAGGPFAVDAYLPGMPAMSDSLGVGIDHIATTISYYVLGMALGQLIGGPLADKFQKRSLIVTGLAIYALSSLSIASSNDIVFIQIVRIIQAIGGGFAIVCVPPLVREREQGNAAAKLFGLIGLIFIIAPAIAPTIGGLILMVGNWQSIFYFMSAYAVLVIVFVLTSLPKDPEAKGRQTIPVLKRYWIVMQNKTALRYLVAQSSGYAIMMIFITNSSFIYQQHYGLSEQVFGLVFALNTIFNVIVNRVNSRLLSRVSAGVWGASLKVYLPRDAPA